MASLLLKSLSRSMMIEPLVAFSIRKFDQTSLSRAKDTQFHYSGSSAEEILSVRLEAKLKKPALEAD